jgi:putative ABC transport system ATP-binding protein
MTAVFVIRWMCHSVADINVTQHTTCVMVTHNPDIECYGDRILYVQDGKFVQQAVNTQQSKLDHQKYLAYLKSVEEADA